MADPRQALITHLKEIRKRLVACAIGLGVAFAVCYAFSEQLFQVLALPLKKNLAPGETLVYTNLPDMFFVYIKVAFVAGLVFASPFLFYQFWLSIAPRLPKKERRLLLPFLLSSTLLFVGGGLFGYFVVFPFGFKFFLSFENEYLQALPSVRLYFSFAVKVLLMFGLVFELPVLIFFLARTGAVTPASLRRKRRYAILLSFILGAVLTPPDVISQFLMAVPLILLYEIGILSATFAGSPRRTQDPSPSQE
jgi:sec-independent protein translocase protein TatC